MDAHKKRGRPQGKESMSEMDAPIIKLAQQLLDQDENRQIEPAVRQAMELWLSYIDVVLPGLPPRPAWKWQAVNTESGPVHPKRVARVLAPTPTIAPKLSNQDLPISPDDDDDIPPSPRVPRFFSASDPVAQRIIKRLRRREARRRVGISVQ